MLVWTSYQIAYQLRDCKQEKVEVIYLSRYLPLLGMRPLTATGLPHPTGGLEGWKAILLDLVRKLALHKIRQVRTALMNVIHLQ